MISYVPSRDNAWAIVNEHPTMAGRIYDFSGRLVGFFPKFCTVISGNFRYGTSSQRYWFVFPLQSFTEADFASATEAMGAVLVTCGGYINAFVDQVVARFQIPASRVVLCGHQHGACAALAAAMIRRENPFALAVVFDPWPLETLYLRGEHLLPETKIVCIDNQWVRARDKQRGTEFAMVEGFRRYGMNAEGITLAEGEGKPDEYMFREAIRQVKLVLR